MCSVNNSKIEFFPLQSERNLHRTLAWQPTWTDECGVKCLDPISSHDYFNVTTGVKSIQLVQELQHGPLDLPLSSRVGVISTQGTLQSIHLCVYYVMLAML